MVAWLRFGWAGGMKGGDEEDEAEEEEDSAAAAAAESKKEREVEVEGGEESAPRLAAEALGARLPARLASLAEALATGGMTRNKNTKKDAERAAVELVELLSSSKGPSDAGVALLAKALVFASFSSSSGGAEEEHRSSRGLLPLPPREELAAAAWGGRGPPALEAPLLSRALASALAKAANDQDSRNDSSSSQVAACIVEAAERAIVGVSLLGLGQRAGEAAAEEKNEGDDDDDDDDDALSIAPVSEKSLVAAPFEEEEEEEEMVSDSKQPPVLLQRALATVALCLGWISYSREKDSRENEGKKEKKRGGDDDDAVVSAAGLLVRCLARRPPHVSPASPSSSPLPSVDPLAALAAVASPVGAFLSGATAVPRAALRAAPPALLAALAAALGNSESSSSRGDDARLAVVLLLLARLSIAEEEEEEKGGGKREDTLAALGGERWLAASFLSVSFPSSSSSDPPLPSSKERDPRIRHAVASWLADRVEARSPQLFAEALRKASNSSLSSSSAAALSAAPQLEAALSTGLLELL